MTTLQQIADRIDPRKIETALHSAEVVSTEMYYEVPESALIAASDALRAMAWRPIETAPKDGRWLIGWAERDAAVYRISWGRNHNDKLAWCTAFASFVDGYITHFCEVEFPTPPGETDR